MPERSIHNHIEDRRMPTLTNPPAATVLGTRAVRLLALRDTLSPHDQALALQAFEGMRQYAAAHGRMTPAGQAVLYDMMGVFLNIQDDEPQAKEGKA
jgi:hypothetical protein